MTDDLRRRALDSVDAELERLRGLGAPGVAELAGTSPHDARAGADVMLTTRVEREGERLMVLVEAWRGRRILATGGFAMTPDGQTHTPD